MMTDSTYFAKAFRLGSKPPKSALGITSRTKEVFAIRDNREGALGFR